MIPRKTRPNKREIECALSRLKSKLQGSLRSYQEDAVRWMLEKEFTMGGAQCGLLADDMGLGKTYMVAALIRAHPRTTLIVCPLSVLQEWHHVLSSFGNIRHLLVSTSAQRQTIPQFHDDDGVVLVANTAFSRKTTPECLMNKHWGRVVLDEAHCVKNPDTELYKTLTKVKTDFRWALTATPIQNTEKDVQTLYAWLGISKFSKEEQMSLFFLRRSQHTLSASCPELVLEPLRSEIRFITLHAAEQHIYDRLARIYNLQDLGNGAQDADIEGGADLDDESSVSARGGKGSLVGIMKARQLCASHHILDDDARERVGLARKDGRTKPVTRHRARETDHAALDLSSGSEVCGLVAPIVDGLMDSTTIECDGEYADVVLGSDGLPLLSTKMRCLCDAIEIEPADTKCIVFGFFRKELDMIQEELVHRGIGCEMFHGSLSSTERANALYNFREVPSISVLVAQIQCASVGLNLQVASRVFITTPHWNPCVELQAIGRAYRQGQQRQVKVTRFVVRGSIEEYCLQKQNAKLKLIRSSMGSGWMDNFDELLGSHERKRHRV